MQRQEKENIPVHSTSGNKHGQKLEDGWFKFRIQLSRLWNKYVSCRNFLKTGCIWRHKWEEKIFFNHRKKSVKEKEIPLLGYSWW